MSGNGDGGRRCGMEWRGGVEVIVGEGQWDRARIAVEWRGVRRRGREAEVGQKRCPFPCQVSFRTKERLELAHSDLCRPMTPATPGGWFYFLLLVDDISWYMWVVLMDTKEAAVDAI